MSNRTWYEATIHISSDDTLRDIVTDLGVALRNRLADLGFPNAEVISIGPDRLTLTAYHEEAEA